MKKVKDLPDITYILWKYDILYLILKIVVINRDSRYIVLMSLDRGTSVPELSLSRRGFLSSRT